MDSSGGLCAGLSSDWVGARGSGVVTVLVRVETVRLSPAATTQGMRVYALFPSIGTRAAVSTNIASR